MNVVPKTTCSCMCSTPECDLVANMQHRGSTENIAKTALQKAECNRAAAAAMAVNGTEYKCGTVASFVGK